MKNVRLISMLGAFIFFIQMPEIFSQPTGSWLASPETVKRLSEKTSGINYYENRVPSYSLPDVLTSVEGQKITNSRKWMKVRRPEILELFRENVYGRVPVTPYVKVFRLVNEEREAMGGNATLRQVDILITSHGDTLPIHLILFVPNKIPKPVPAFLLIDNRGPENRDPARKITTEFWPAEQIVARGYAAAVFSNADIDPDYFDDFKNGIHGLLDMGNRKPDSWGTIAAWAWGASRCMDYLVTDRDIDSTRVALVGHSRGGKTALWAGAEDQRFSLIVANESGCGGSALARRRYGETIARITEAFPHWFCANYKKWANNEDKMPLDMHMLVSLIAPRGVYITSAAEDLWADPKGSYISLYNATPVFRLFDPETNLSEFMPPLNEPVYTGKVAYHIREGEHNMLLRDWNWFMDFADRILK